jgi:antitoxin component of MazEF toxin-antitoxin module
MHVTRVFKAGNSLAIRLPGAIAKRLSLRAGAVVEMGADEGTLYVYKVPSQALPDLIDRITPENVHAAAFGDLTGSERW